MSGDCPVFKFLQRRVDEKRLMQFRRETSVFKFLRRSVNEASLADRKLTEENTKLPQTQYI